MGRSRLPLGRRLDKSGGAAESLHHVSGGPPHHGLPKTSLLGLLPSAGSLPLAEELHERNLRDLPFEAPQILLPNEPGPPMRQVWQVGPHCTGLQRGFNAAM